MSDRNDLVIAEDITCHFPIRRGLFGRQAGVVRAVDGVSFRIPSGRTLGLVGESGCGKTTLGRTLLRLIPPTAGRFMFDGHDVFSLSAGPLRQLRRSMQMIFQDPVGSLNPRMTVGNIIGQALAVHGVARGKQCRDCVGSLLDRVGLSATASSRYPHEFSGGQRQRIGIARALALSPKFIVCDEPVSALDVSIQSQIINLLQDLQDELHLTYLFIAHDLAVVEHISDDLAVMYLGRIVEHAPAEVIYRNPLHPYTQTLLSAIPRIDHAGQAKHDVATGQVPPMVKAPSGCPYHPRCPRADDRCRTQSPDLLPHKEDALHDVSCWHA